MAQPKTLEIERLMEYEGGPMGYFARGHWEPADFLEAVEAYAEEWDRAEKRDPVPLGGDFLRPALVRREYWRCVPPPGGGRGSVFIIARGPGRGAFAVTVIE